MSVTNESLTNNVGTSDDPVVKKKKVQMDRNYSVCKYFSVCLKICLKNIYLTFGRGKLHGMRELETMWKKTDKFLAMNDRIHKAN